jgi:hypothetical protein
MAYGTILADVHQSSTAGTPPVFNDGSGNQIGTLCRAWVNFNGVTTATIRASFNVSSVTRNSTGIYTVNFTNAMPDSNYSANISTAQASGLGGSTGIIPVELLSGASIFGRTTTSIPFLTVNAGFTVSDSFSVSVAIFR